MFLSSKCYRQKVIHLSLKHYLEHMDILIEWFRKFLALLHIY